MLPDGITFELIEREEIDLVKITLPNGWEEYCDPTDKEFMLDLIHEARMEETIRQKNLDDAATIYHDGCTMDQFLDL